MEQVIPQMLSEKHVAKMLNVSVAALRRWRREGRGPDFTRCERCIRYSVSAIQRYASENSSASKKAADLHSAARKGARDMTI